MYKTIVAQIKQLGLVKPSSVQSTYPKCDCHHDHSDSNDHSCVTIISSLPIIITKPGRYKLCKDIKWNGEKACNTAITILSSDVEINLNHYAIFGDCKKCPKTFGIVVKKEKKVCDVCYTLENITIRNGRLSNMGVFAIYCTDVTGLTIKDLLLSNNGNCGAILDNGAGKSLSDDPHVSGGIYLENCREVVIRNVSIVDSDTPEFSTPIYCIRCIEIDVKNVNVENCEGRQVSYGLLFYLCTQLSSENIKINNIGSPTSILTAGYIDTDGKGGNTLTNVSVTNSTGIFFVAISSDVAPPGLLLGSMLGATSASTAAGPLSNLQVLGNSASRGFVAVSSFSSLVDGVVVSANKLELEAIVVEEIDRFIGVEVMASTISTLKNVNVHGNSFNTNFNGVLTTNDVESVTFSKKKLLGGMLGKGGSNRLPSAYYNILLSAISSNTYTPPPPPPVPPPRNPEVVAFATRRSVPRNVSSMLGAELPDGLSIIYKDCVATGNNGQECTSIGFDMGGHLYSNWSGCNSSGQDYGFLNDPATAEMFSGNNTISNNTMIANVVAGITDLSTTDKNSFHSNTAQFNGPTGFENFSIANPVPESIWDVNSAAVSLDNVENLSIVPA